MRTAVHRCPWFLDISDAEAYFSALSGEGEEGETNRVAAFVSTAANCQNGCIYHSCVYTLLQSCVAVC